MPPSVEELEQQRSLITRQLTELGDFRPGSITTTSGRCGKPSCHCHRPNQPPHGPTDRLTYKVAGKTVSESLPNPAALAKAQREVAEFRNYQQLSQQLVEVNMQICRARPVEVATSQPQEKNGGSDPKGNCPRSRPAIERDLSGPPQVRPSGSGGRRNDRPIGDASGGGRRADETVAVRSAGPESTGDSLFLRPFGALQGTAREDRLDRAGAGKTEPPLLSLRALLARALPAGRRTGGRRSGILARRPPHGSGGGQRDAVRLRLRADEGARGPRRSGQSHRACRGGHWPPDRPSRRAGNRPRQATRAARGNQTEHSENVCADGRRSGARGSQGNGRPGRKNSRATGPHARV